jgi:hypothetical protein
MEAGKYKANATGNVEVGDHANGCLIAVIEFALENGETISSTSWLTTKDGAINTKAIETLKEVFGWNGLDPFWLVDNAQALKDVEVELVIEMESFTGRDGTERSVPKVKWINPVGRGTGGVALANTDRAALLAKYGAKLRAVSGGVQQAPTAKPPVAAKPPAKAPPAKKSAIAQASQYECWNAITAGMADKPRAQVEDQWFELLKDTCGEKDASEFTPEDWGAVLERLRKMFDNLPF